MQTLGLIGYPISHSFSKKYFQEKFLKEKIENITYELFPLQNIEKFPDLLAQHKQWLGLNVTIPYKESIIAYLDELSEEAQKIGAVNTIHFEENKKIGYNTDYEGFKKSLEQIALPQNTKALVLGTGGASKAIQVALQNLHIPFLLVSHSSKPHSLPYEMLDAKIMKEHSLIINTTPLGMQPQTDTFPPIPYDYITEAHFLYDLVYNPEETTFLKKGAEKNAKTKNGLEMLYLQAEAAWKIWQKS
ncbi:MAG: shikimate dehydrogenase [Thermonemataceae bacterium]|nr:shikimate dehydrogenase [Thermonemataceae bacterium]